MSNEINKDTIYAATVIQRYFRIFLLIKRLRIIVENRRVERNPLKRTV